jgi:hypothetical protein
MTRIKTFTLTLMLAAGLIFAGASALFTTRTSGSGMAACCTGASCCETGEACCAAHASQQ